MYFVVVVGKQAGVLAPGDELERVKRAEAFMESRNCNGRVLVFLTNLEKIEEYDQYQNYLLERVGDRTAILPVEDAEILKVTRRLQQISFPIQTNATASKKGNTMSRALKIADGIGDKTANIIASKQISWRTLGEQLTASEDAKLYGVNVKGMRTLLTTPL